ncbi:MAG: sensor domain-containing diguanylate cyclase [Desulfotomaculaceae bacterium]|nr:sensor domain-containing diguanylate cyclase [Desulfotomaculaceae bacterium]
MQLRQNFTHIFYTWLVVALAIWQLCLLFPALDMDRGRDLICIVFLGMLAEWLAVALPHGQFSVNFALVLSTFLIFGPAATAWVSGLSAVFGLGIANRGVSVRTTLFNACQYVLAAIAAGYVFKLCAGVPGLVSMSNAFPLAAFTISYIVINHLLVYFYLLPKQYYSPPAAWLEALKWDGMTYLLTVPLGLLVAINFAYTGLSGLLLLFSLILVLQLIMRFYMRFLLREADRELAFFHEVAMFLEKEPRPQKVLAYIIKVSKRVFSYHSGVAYFRSGDGRAYVPVAVSGPYSRELQNTAVYMGEGIIGRSLINQKPEIVFDSRRDPRTRNEAGLCQVMRSLLIIPLFSGKEASGIIVLGDKAPMYFDEKHMRIMVVLGGQAAIHAEKWALGSRIEYAASRDALTGLLISSAFYQAVIEVCEKVGEEKASVGLMIIDVDHFKLFNDRYGRQYGDWLLAELAGLIEDCTYEDEIAGRYGGDEFAILLPNTDCRPLMDVAGRLIKEVRGGYFLENIGRQARITVSIGVAEYPRDASDVPGLFRAAQRALEKAKKDGRDRASAAVVSMIGLSH